MSYATPFLRHISVLANPKRPDGPIYRTEVQYPTGDKSYLWRHLPHPQRMRRIARLARFLAARNLPNFPLEG